MLGTWRPRVLGSDSSLGDGGYSAGRIADGHSANLNVSQVPSLSRMRKGSMCRSYSPLHG